MLVATDPRGELPLIYLVTAEAGPVGLGTLRVMTLCGQQLVVCGCRHVEMTAEVVDSLCFGCRARAGLRVEP